MALTLYEVTVRPFLQTVGAVGGILDRGLAHCTENNINPDDIVNARLVENMLPFRFQIMSVAHHSLGAIEAVKAGVSGPPSGEALDYSGLQKLIADTHAGLTALKPEEINDLQRKDVVFKMPGMAIPFTAEGYLLSFAIPNLHFHATTAYDILRMKGAPLGKRDYLGALQIKV
jgi:hypothetical protein